MHRGQQRLLYMLHHDVGEAAGTEIYKLISWAMPAGATDRSRNAQETLGCGAVCHRRGENLTNTGALIVSATITNTHRTGYARLDATHKYEGDCSPMFLQHRGVRGKAGLGQGRKRRDGAGPCARCARRANGVNWLYRLTSRGAGRCSRLRAPSAGGAAGTLEPRQRFAPRRIE